MLPSRVSALGKSQTSLFLGIFPRMYLQALAEQSWTQLGPLAPEQGTAGTEGN